MQKINMGRQNGEGVDIEVYDGLVYQVVFFFSNGSYIERGFYQAKPGAVVAHLEECGWERRYQSPELKLEKRFIVRKDGVETAKLVVLDDVFETDRLTPKVVIRVAEMAFGTREKVEVISGCQGYRVTPRTVRKLTYREFKNC